MAHTRDCEQCGSVFAPRREHARFCSARCRVAWNREQARDRSAEISALDWSVTAMGDATGRLLRVRARDRARALAVISEAVWWVTIVDATLVRYHPDTYDAVLAGQIPPERPLIEETLAGLRFVRNQMGQEFDHVDFICPRPSRSSSGNERITAWTWRPVPEPTLTSLRPGAQEWELTRYRAYQGRLAGHTVGETFTRAGTFLQLAAAQDGSQGEPGLLSLR